MAALAQERMRKAETWRSHRFMLTSGTKAYKGGQAALDLAGSGKVVPGTTGTGLLKIGVFAETVDATSASLPVQVDLINEFTVEWFANDTTTAVTSANIGGMAYMLDDQTVTGSATGNSIAGRVWAVDSVKGVAVEKTASSDKLAPNGATLSYTTNNAAPAAIASGSIYDVPTTAAASTITLPAAAPDGTVAYFAADGVKNGHTIQYVDATGSTNLTTALTASKRHLAVVAKRGGKWFANVYVGP